MSQIKSLILKGITLHDIEQIIEIYFNSDFFHFGNTSTFITGVQILFQYELMVNEG